VLDLVHQPGPEAALAAGVGNAGGSNEFAGIDPAASKPLSHARRGPQNAEEPVV
jgi:hypothetical protein